MSLQILRSASRACAAAFLGLSIAACSVLHPPAEDVDLRYRARIVIKAEQKTLAIFPRQGLARLDPMQSAKISDFARSYRAEGRGPLRVLVPQDAKGHAPRPTAILAELSRAGVRPGGVTVGAYAPDVRLEPPVRLSYEAASADALCDERPSGKLVRDPAAALMGCAFASAVARTAADPLDLAEPRATGLYTFTATTGGRLAGPATPATPGTGTR